MQFRGDAGITSEFEGGSLVPRAKIPVPSFQQFIADGVDHVLDSMSISKYFDMKLIALISLVLQNSGLIVMMRYTIVAAAPGERYFASTAVFMAELIKLVISTCLVFYLDGNCTLSGFKAVMKQELVDNKIDWVKLTVPSLLYTIQNSLQYVSMSLLSAPVFQVLYQMKIITTALFSVLLLAKRITGLQWFSVVALTAGVGLVQLSQLDDNSSNKSNSLAGLISVILSCLTSGFAGVYFEMVLKSSNASVWLRNVQLSVIGGILSIMACHYRDGDKILDKGFFHGYNNFVWSVILLQAVGGMIVAVVVKYADNVLKGFATSISILTSCIASSILLNDVDFNVAFYTGSLVVLSAVFLYSYTPPPALLQSLNGYSAVAQEEGVTKA